MKRTYRISKGQQYDRGGAYVEHGRLSASYRADGTFDAGSPVALADLDAVAEVVQRVIASGQPETLEIGADAPAWTAEQIASYKEGAARMRRWQASDV